MEGDLVKDLKCVQLVTLGHYLQGKKNSNLKDYRKFCRKCMPPVFLSVEDKLFSYEIFFFF